MKIAVWSPTPFAGRKTVNLLWLAMQVLRTEGREQLIIHADPSGSGPEHFLLSGAHRSRMMEKKEFGVELLCKMMHCERITREMIVDASYSFAEEKLHILPPGHKAFYEESAVAARELHRVLHGADRLFRNVWIELPAGENRLAKEIFPAVDCIIVNFAQSPGEIAKLDPVIGFAPVFYIVGAYEQRNVFSLHNLQLQYPFLRGRCCGVPYHVGLVAACCAGEAEAFFLREQEKRMQVPSLFFERMMHGKQKEGDCTNALDSRETERKGKTTGDCEYIPGTGICKIGDKKIFGG